MMFRGLRRVLENENLTTSLLRIVPETLDVDDERERQVLELHLERYRFAEKFCAGKRVLDIACGVGYGADLLCRTAREITAVDLDAKAIHYAEARYSRDKLRFLCSPYEALVVAPPAGFGEYDVVVSLETIAHLSDPRHFVRALREWLSPRGLLVISTPVTPCRDFSPVHRHDFNASTICQLLQANGFFIVESFQQSQRLNWNQLRLRQDLARYYLKHPGRLGARVWSLIWDGFATKYLTLAASRLPSA
jgi:2-polyprenyl-3-methyl-5-hydroxy-6-metoxy-1,4-benzoquinol methylase